jgi:serine phosphatase RsbU (regulator of sigma subunit)
MAPRRSASISLKMILTSTALVLVVVSLSGAVSALYTRRIFDESAGRLRAVLTEAIERRGLSLVLTLAETARTALIQNDYGTLKSVVPQAARKNPDVLAIYIVADTGVVVAHSQDRFNTVEQPLEQVDPDVGPRLGLDKLSEPLTRILDANGKAKEGGDDRRFVFASPVTALGKRQGSVVVLFSLHSLDAEIARIETEKLTATRANLTRTVAMGLVFLLLGTAMAIGQGLRISRPIELLALRADQIARGDLDTRVELTSRDEIGLLAANFNYMADRLQVLLRETAAKATLEKELELARTIQETLVPSGEVFDRGVLLVAGHFQPATQCGGDFWTVHDLPDGKVLLVIGDVTGHGVPSAMITAAAKAACDVVRTLDGAQLTAGRLLSLMNRAIYESARRKFVMTCFASIVDLRTRTITYANAGHNFPYLYRQRPDVQAGENEFTVLMSRGNRLGDLPESSYTESAQQLRQGDVLVFYTDGIVECENSSDEEYGEKRFRGSIRAAAGLPPAAMRDGIVAAAAQFYGDRQRKDDITLVVARVQ